MSQFNGSAFLAWLAVHAGISMISAIGLRVLMAIAMRLVIPVIVPYVNDFMEAAKRGLFVLALALFLPGCAALGGNSPDDPWEGFNRKTFALNDAVDRTVLKPVAKAYVRTVPGFARTGVRNFFANLADIGTGLNNVLQGKLRDGAGDLGRFGINTVVGVAGLWDVATPVGLQKHNEDFGQTLGWWGMPPGPYVVLPLFGPSTARDAPAKLVDPSHYYSSALGNGGAYWGYWAGGAVNTRANLLPADKVLDEAALDRYAFVRDAWLQRRESQVHDGAVPREKPR
jgi:phospholipid-binding lipoprotein MlaA